VRVAIGSDHAGFALKGELCSLLDELRVEYRDFGIVLGGSGTGEAIVANKVRGVRCVQATNPVVARLAREHNNANVIAFGARIVGTEVARACVREFLTAQFQGGRHVPRLEKLARIEAEEASR
jgi:ribose 5-phosphate isomerase B